jgi:putative flippase GtrA
MTDTVWLLKFLKFCAVGFSGMLIDFGLTWTLKEKVRINQYIANSCGFMLAVVSNYVWNRLWTFGSHNDRITTEFLSFLIISLIGVGINNLILWALTDRFRLHFYFSKLCAIGVVTLWNFSMNLLVTFP